MKKETILIIALTGLSALASSTFFLGMAAHGVISKPESSESSIVSEISSEESYSSIVSEISSEESESAPEESIPEESEPEESEPEESEPEESEPEESYNENADYIVDKGSYSYHLVKTADELKIELEADSYIGTVTVTIAHEQEELDFSYNAEGEEFSIREEFSVSFPDEKYGYKTVAKYTVTNSKTVTLQAALTGKADVTKEVAVTPKYEMELLTYLGIILVFVTAGLIGVISFGAFVASILKMFERDCENS